MRSPLLNRQICKMTIISILVVFSLVSSGIASAYEIDFSSTIFTGGGVSFTNANSDAFMNEKVTFAPAIVDWWDVADPLFTASFGQMFVYLSPGTLSQTNYTSGVTYSFDPTTYANGFALAVLTGGGIVPLLYGDLTLNSIDIMGIAAGSVNSYLGMNISGLTAAPAYFSGLSPIIDAFLANPGGAMVVTFQVGGNLSSKIEGTTAFATSYSGSAVPVVEPSTLLLLGVALLGLGVVGKKLRLGRGRI